MLGLGPRPRNQSWGGTSEQGYKLIRRENLKHLQAVKPINTAGPLEGGQGYES